MIELRDYQRQSVDGIRRRYLEGYRSPLLVLPTGGGKTIVFAHIAATTAANTSGGKQRKVLILVHRVELLRQTASKLRAFGVRTGLISPLFTPDYSAPVQVAMIQTMVKRMEAFKDFDLIVIDEAHHTVANNYVQVLSNFPNAYQLGVTATPIRGDGKGLGVQAGGPFDSMVLGPSVETLIQRGFLVRPVVYGATETVDFSNIGTVAGDLNKKQQAERVNKKRITGNAVDHYRSICGGDPAVAFCVNVQHAEDVAAEFRAMGYKFYSVDGKTDDAVRERIFKQLGDGTIHGVTSCDIISEGTDIPAISAAIMLRRTLSTGLFLQQGGRALRPVEGKERAFILDHVQNYSLHGFLDDEREWSLDGMEKKGFGNSKKKNTGPTPRQCHECFAVYSHALNVCPQCGTARLVADTKVEVMEGQLVELSEEEKERIRQKKTARMEVGRAKTLADLEAVAASRGYKPGWAEHVFRSRQKQ